MKKAMGVMMIVIAALAAVAPAQTYTAALGAGVAIPDGLSTAACSPGAAATATLTVPANYGPASSILITVGITHTWVGDVEAIVTTPMGSKITLLIPFCNGNFDDSSNLGGNYVFNDNLTTTVMTSALAAACGDACVVTPGSYLPETPMLPHLQCGVGGVWSLSVRDYLQIDSGTLTAFSITLASGAPVNGVRESFVICQTGPGAPVILAHANGPTGGSYFNPMVFNTPSSVPNGWFYGLNIPFQSIIAEINFPYPGLFLGSFSGTSSVVSVPGIAPGLQVSIVALHFDAAGQGTWSSFPVTYTTI